MYTLQTGILLPVEVADMMFMGYDIPESFIHQKKEQNKSMCHIW